MKTSFASPLSNMLAGEEGKLLACIHCGLCLEACPTYVVTGDENDGPRGRLYLMRAVGEGRLENNSAAFERHIDRCLGCRACEQVCPAGVEYGQLLEAARGELFVSSPKRGFRYRLLRLILRQVWLHPARLRFAFTAARLIRDSGVAHALRRSGLAKLFSKQLQFALALLESSAPKLKTANLKSRQRRREDRSAGESSTSNTTMLFTGCVGAGLFSRVNEATARALGVNGFAVQSPSDQVCCGALHAHAGDLEGARTLARQNIAAFAVGEAFQRGPLRGNPAGVVRPVRSELETTAGDSQDPPIITNAGGCGAMLLSYAHLLADDELFAERARQFSARVRDISQQLETVDLKQGAAGTTHSITYDASCHLLYGQHAGEAPLNMVSAIPELDFTPLAGSERCCGGAGIYNLLEPDLSSQVLAEKLASIQATGAKILATGNPGCQMQIGAGALLAGMELTVCHPVELLDEAYARRGMYEES
jgi:glycolate oxidase iron-sulfur subunit